MILNKKIARSESALSTSLDGEEIVLNLTNNEYISLNTVASEIWRILEHPSSLEEIVDELVKLYEVESGRCERDVLELVERMSDLNLVKEKNS